MSEIIITPIRLSLSTAYLIQDHGAVLVDTGTAKDCGKLLGALQKAGVGPDDISMILLTHGHADHVGSVSQLKSTCSKAEVALHADDLPMVREGQNAEIFPTGVIGRLVRSMFNKAPFTAFDPHRIFEWGDAEEFDLSPFGVRATVVRTPGHTSGSVSIVTETGDALVGDLVAGGYLNFWMTKRPTLPTYVYHENVTRCIGEIVTSLHQLLKRGVHTFHVGHGGPLHAADVQNFVDRLRATYPLKAKSALQDASASPDRRAVQAGR